MYQVSTAMYVDARGDWKGKKEGREGKERERRG
jgi:hypothetical protein